MPSQDIDVQFEAGGLTLTLNRAAKVNALSTPMMLRITEAIRQAQADRCTHIVLRSALPGCSARVPIFRNSCRAKRRWPNRAMHCWR